MRTTTTYCKSRHVAYGRCLAGLLLAGFGLAITAQAQTPGSVTTTQSFSYTGQIVTWTVPTGVTSLTIEARGAEGAANRNSGRGAILRGVVSVTPAQTLTLLVGGQPPENRGYSTAGGGGGSFVVTTLNNVLQPLVIAGGGGGGGNLTTDSPAKHGQTGTAGGGATNSGGMGGTDGKGGQGGSGQYAASGGGGLFTDGTGFAGGQAFVNGGRGGRQDETGSNGGFGGGGSAIILITGDSKVSIAGGGGGGYSGGGGASANGDGTGGGYGGGGGSYTIDPNGTAQVGATNGNPGNGLVTISYLPPCSPFTVSLQNDSDLTCVKKSGLLTTTGGPTGASYNYSPGAQASSTSSTTATVTTSGLYSVTVTAPGGCSATATTNVQSNTVAPGSPMLVTATGYPYPAGVSSLTLSQNVGPVSLTASGCSDGQLSTSGGGSSFTISTSMTGTQTYTATCTSNNNGCTSPAASFQLTVVPTTLSVLHRDADYGNTGNNIIKPYLQLANADGNAIPYGEVTVRYWFTSEGNALPTNLAVYYAQLGAVNMKYVALSQPRQGALGYVEYSFPGGGSLAGGSNSGPIENGIQKTDGSNFNETDDYSYQANYQNYVGNTRVTAYRNGVIVYGQEPTAVSSVTAVQVYTQAKDQTTTSQIQTRLELRNTGNRAIPVQDLRIRYYFSSDNNQTASVYVDYADIGASNILARVVKLPAPVGGADSYVELRTVPTSLSLAASSSLGAIDFRLVRSDNGLFNQSNDYSYAPNYGNGGLNNRVTVLLNNRLIFGTPPAGAPYRLGVNEAGAELAVKVLGNPVVGDQAQLVITGVAGQAVSLRLMDLQGRAVHEQRIEQAGETELVSVPLGQSRGLLLLKVSTDSQQQSVKLLRP